MDGEDPRLLDSALGRLEWLARRVYGELIAEGVPEPHVRVELSAGKYDMYYKVVEFRLNEDTLFDVVQEAVDRIADVVKKYVDDGCDTHGYN